MLPTKEEIIKASETFANTRFNYEVKGVAKSSFLDGAEWMLSKFCNSDDAGKVLSSNYTSLKSMYWELKRRNENTILKNKELRKYNKELIEKFFDIAERLESLDKSKNSITENDLL